MNWNIGNELVKSTPDFVLMRLVPSCIPKKYMSPITWHVCHFLARRGLRTEDLIQIPRLEVKVQAGLSGKWSRASFIHLVTWRQTIKRAQIVQGFAISILEPLAFLFFRARHKINTMSHHGCSEYRFTVIHRNMFVDVQWCVVCFHMFLILGITDEVLRRGCSIPILGLCLCHHYPDQCSWTHRGHFKFDEIIHRRFGGESKWEIVPCRACVRACTRSGCLVELDLKNPCHHVPFSLRGRRASPFPFFGRRGFPFLSPHPPKLLSNFSWVYRYEEP